MDPICFRLPWPPSVNTMWRFATIKGRRRVLLSAKGRRYRSACFHELMMQRVPKAGLQDGIRVSIAAFPPDNRHRDLDNLLKATCDVMQKWGIITNDSGIEELEIKRGSALKAQLYVEVGLCRDV